MNVPYECTCNENHLYLYIHRLYAKPKYTINQNTTVILYIWSDYHWLHTFNWLSLFSINLLTKIKPMCKCVPAKVTSGIAYACKPNLMAPSPCAPSITGSYHYNDVIMRAIASQITSRTIVNSIVYSDADHRKHQSSASLTFVREIHRGPVNSPH